MVRTLLGLCRFLRPVLILARVDEQPFRALLRVKLILHQRSVGRRSGSFGILQNVGFALLLAFYALVGFGLGGLAFLIHEPVAYMSIAMTATVMMLAFPLVVDFSHLLVDTSDVALIAPLPVSGRTLLATRIVHVSMYVGLILLALAWGPVLLGSLAFGSVLFPVVYLFSLGAIGALTLLGIALLYLLVLRSVDLSRFQDAIVYVQVTAVVLLYAGMQLGPRVAQRLGVLDWLKERPELLAYFPPAWFGGLLATALGETSQLNTVLSICAVAGPVVLSAVVLLVARGGILARLSEMSEAARPRRERPRRHGLSGRIAPWITRSPLERAGYDFLLGLSSTDRGFKMRTWPVLSVGVFSLISVVLLDDLASAAQALPFLAYLPLLAVPAVTANMRFSEHYQANWCFADLDHHESGEVLKGALEALLVRYLAIPLILLIPLCLAVAGPGCWLDLGFACAATVTIAFGLAPELIDEMPFTRKFVQSQASSNAGMALFVMLLLAISIGLQIGLAQIPSAFAVAALSLTIAAVFAVRRFLGRRILAEPVQPSVQGRRRRSSRRSASSRPKSAITMRGRKPR